MADETKAENVEVKTADIGNAVDELLKEKPEGSMADEGGDRSAEKQKDSNGGWLTMLPKELRDGVDASKYSSLGEYIKDLREHQQKADDSDTKEEMDSEWEKMLSDSISEGESESARDSFRKVLDALKAEGVRAKDARRTIELYDEAVTKANQENARKRTERFESYVRDNWKDDAKANFDEAKRGLAEIANVDKELLKTAKAEGLTESPAFLEVCRILGQRTSEAGVTVGSKSAKRSDYDPKNPLRY